MRSCIRISLDFCTDGFDVITKYSKYSFEPYSSKPKTYCFDGLGSEQIGTYWGKTRNVMADILLTRYEYFISRGMLTHVTTTLNAKELENVYGTTLRSCMRSMFNLISFDANSTDKRT
jgi:hypothetical protein